ncbi:52 kDa repressor of the inhibitor of the protein kinase-like isoform X3 [Portunus trituberculatus]|uniref:52 kDa repressor of the inhibitor of the protein kinase-like isoform X3 n=1 Tax=Portunus trituberculatus TaxID=210409 RepID=UPI001E1CF62A|nr:52 kDa repressor of the inhibitor of the protein kinase-like isoform X3 [Portunus trituberculatus]
MAGKQMPRSCCVPGCKANYSSSDASAFHFPKDEARRLQWVKAIHREDFTPNQNSVVCARHFEDHFIIREDSMTRPDGTVITAKRGKPTLTKDAYPTIFPNHPQYMSKKAPPARVNPQVRKDKALERDELQFQDWMKDDMINTFSDFCDNFVPKVSKD